MKYTYTKTIKNILDFFSNKINYTYTKLDGIIYKDEVNNAYFQTIDMELDIEKGVNKDSRFITITEELKYRPDRLGYICYGNENLVWIILKFNNITNPFELELGDVLEIPSLQVVSAAIQKKRQMLQYK